MQIEHISPADTYNSIDTRGYTQVVAVTGMQKLIILSGQLPLDADNKLVGDGDIEAQTRACYENLKRALQAAGADLGNVVRMTTYVTDLGNHPKCVPEDRAEYFVTLIPHAS